MTRVPDLSRPTRLALAAAVAVLSSACSMVPTYERPASPVPAQWSEGAASSAQADAAPLTAEQLSWRNYFPDERLQRLVQASLLNNRDLRVAVLNIEQTRAQYRIQRADQFPTIGLQVNAQRQPSTVPPFDVSTVATAGVALSAFELDLFGRVRALSESAAAQLFASEEARKAAQISLVAQVANTYYAIWADRWQLALAEQTLRGRESSLKLQQLKYDNGVLNELDLRSAQSLVEAARVSRAQAERQWRQDSNALALLVGQPVAAADLPPAPDVPVATSVDDMDAFPRLGSSTLWPQLSELPVGLPSDVLLRRPDIAQAEQQLISANANIGAARAAMFPRISLTASAGQASDSLSGVFDDGRSVWSVTGNLLQPIFDAGRNRANVTLTELRRDVTVAQYEKAVQSAFREVSDALVARQTYGEQALAQQAQADAEFDRLRLSALRYRTGVASQIDLLDAQRNLFSAQQALIQAQLARQQAHITVFRTLGGGWDQTPPAEQQSQAAPVAAPAPVAVPGAVRSPS